ncbi:MAG: hypothetical protein KGJ07_07850 [Patescibacteria group bacterium]|nr:hypothetical protein [Patescibacteria group bacterium]
MSSVRLKDQKKDQKEGRRPRGIFRSKSFWFAQLKAFKASGLKARSFCEQQGLAYSTFTKWRGILRDEEVSQNVGFVRLEVESVSVAPKREHSKKETFLNKGSHKNHTPSPFESPTSLICQTAQGPELKLTFGKGLTLHIPSGVNVLTLRQVVDALA